MDLAPEYRDRLNSLSPQPNLQEVLVVLGGRSLDDSDEDDSDEDEDRDPRVQRLLRKNCAFYNTKTSTNFFFFFAHIRISSLFKFTIYFTTELCWETSIGFLEKKKKTVWQMCRWSLTVVLTEKQLSKNAVWM